MFKCYGLCVKNAKPIALGLAKGNGVRHAFSRDKEAAG